MKTILVLFSLFATISFGQFSSGTARRIIRDSGAPSSATCDSLSEVSNVYVRLDSASTASPLYICTNTGVGTYGWVLSGAGGAAASCGSATSTQVLVGSGCTGSDLFTWDNAGTRNTITDSATDPTMTWFVDANGQLVSYAVYQNFTPSFHFFGHGGTLATPAVLNNGTRIFELFSHGDVSNGAGGVSQNIRLVSFYAEATTVGTSATTVTDIWLFPRGASGLNYTGGGSPRLTLYDQMAFEAGVIFPTDNTFDIGASGATRPRNVYAGTGFIAGAAVGQSVTTTVRDAAGTGTCTLIFTGGLKTGGTC